MAVEIASFPDTVKKVLLEITGYASGDYKDVAIRVARDAGVDFSQFVPVPSSTGIGVESLFMRVNSSQMTDGWRLLVGAFAINGEVENAALLISPDLKVVKKWILSEVPVGDLEPRPKHRKFVHGLELLEDGSLIFTFDGSISLQRIDACGKRQWVNGGAYHHAVTLDDAGESVWTFRYANTIAQVAVDDGAILRQIKMSEVIESNPMIDILEIRRAHSNDLGSNKRNTTGKWFEDELHLNDVDPLPAHIADQFAGFDAGDLLVSARSLNLLFVLDPDTLKIKWWRAGAVQRQHDPDWSPYGKIIVFNNRMSRDFSEIVSIDPDTFERNTVFDGRKNNFYTRIRGKQQLLNDGGLVVTSSQQGRAFEVNKNGDITLEIVNLKPGSDDTNYVISELKWFPSEQLDTRSWKCPPSS